MTDRWATPPADPSPYEPPPTPACDQCQRRDRALYAAEIIDTWDPWGTSRTKGRFCSKECFFAWCDWLEEIHGGIDVLVRRERNGGPRITEEDLNALAQGFYEASELSITHTAKPNVVEGLRWVLEHYGIPVRQEKSDA